MSKGNYYLIHKVFPKTENCCSEIVWDTAVPNFNYHNMMPFIINKRAIDMLDTGMLIVEIWNKTTTIDHLYGMVKLELAPIIDAMKINDNTISITPLIKNLLPLIIYDGYYPVYSLDELGNVSYLKITLGIGTSNQLSNYLKKHKAVAEIPEKLQTSSDKPVNHSKQDYERNEHIVNYNRVEDGDAHNIQNTNPNNMRRSNQFDEDLERINSILNNDNRGYDNLNIEEMLEQNRKVIDNNRNFKETTLSKFTKEQQYHNPFIVVKEEKPSSPLSISKEQFYIQKEPADGVDKDVIKRLVHESLEQELRREDDKRAKERERERKFEKEHINEMEKQLELEKELLKERERQLQLERERMRETQREIIGRESNLSALTIDKRDKDLSHLEGDNNIREENYDNIPNISNLSPRKKQSHQGIVNTEASGLYTRHTFDITVEKLINIQILSKLSKCYLSYRFFNDCESVKSDILVYTAFDKETSIIDIDMNTSHSVMLLQNENIKEHLSDFPIMLNYKDENGEEVVIGKAILPVEDILDMTNKDKAISTTLFIYGTAKVIYPS
jgi:hypothetical protein